MEGSVQRWGVENGRGKERQGKGKRGQDEALIKKEERPIQQSTHGNGVQVDYE